MKYTITLFDAIAGNAVVYEHCSQPLPLFGTTSGILVRFVLDNDKVVTTNMPFTAVQE